jgi:hypothetical protein
MIAPSAQPWLDVWQERLLLPDYPVDAFHNRRASLGRQIQNKRRLDAFCKRYMIETVYGGDREHIQSGKTKSVVVAGWS